MKALRWIYPLMAAAVLLPCGSAAGDEKLDALVRREQDNVDNEAVRVYGGAVGKLAAVFFIEWAGTGNPVRGHYYYPSRGRDILYLLEGVNPKEGVLLLQEYTVNPDGTREHSASCRLTKEVASGQVAWTGTMNNTDGRVLPMRFSRPR